MSKLKAFFLLFQVFPYIFCTCPETDPAKIDLMMKEMANVIALIN